MTAVSDETGRAAIKPLEWQGTFIDRGDGSKDQAGWEADTGFGVWYEIEQYFGSDSYGYRVSFDYEMIGDHDDPDQAKATAQKHFEKRIRAALSAAPVVQEPVAHQYRVCIAGKWSDWIDLQHSVDKFRSGDWKFNLENGTCELRALYAGTPPAAQEPVAWIRDWIEDGKEKTAICDKGDPGAYPVYRSIPPATPAGLGADEIARAFEAGALAVHNEWCAAIDRGESDPPFRPDFSEAAHDYALALLSRASPDKSQT